MAGTGEITIDDALARFLAEQQTRLSPRTARNYEQVIELLRESLNGYGYQGLTEPEQSRWQRAFDGGDEDAFTRLFGPDKIPENLGEFLGYFMVHKVMAGQELARAAGTVTKKLSRWLGEQDLIDQAAAAEAAERAAAAARELPRAERLAAQLFELTRTAPDLDPDAVADDDWVEDYLALERVAPGALWFEGGIGPLPVPHAASDLAQPGWMLSVVLARVSDRWRLLEVANVYP